MPQNVVVPPFDEAPETVVGGTPQRAFPFEFPFWDVEDILVYVDGVQQDADTYVVAGFSLQAGESVEGGYGSGTVTLDAAVSDCTVTIDRFVVGSRETQFSRTSPLGMAALNGDLNRLTARQQDLERKKVDAPEGVAANSFLAFDADGDAIYSSGTGADAGLRTDLGAAGGSGLVTFDDGQANSATRSLDDYLRDQPINAATYGFVPSATDKGAELQAAVDAAIATGRELYIPAGAYRVDTGVTAYLTETVAGLASFRRGLRIRGAGSGRTIIDSRVASGWLLDISVGDGAGGENAFASFAGILGGYLQGLTIRNGAATTASNGVRLRAQYQFAFRDLHAIALSGTAFKTRGSLGDNDSCNQVSFEDVRADDCGGWGIDTGNDAGHNENSFTSLGRVFIQGCGTAEQKAITGVSQASPGVVTCTGHGFTNGQKVFLGGIAGMVEANSGVAETSYTVTVINANSFSIGVNTTGYTAYTSGGYAFPSVPSSGGLRLKGQTVEGRNCGFTINKNRSVYIDGNGGGLPQDVFFYNTAIENPQLIGLHIQGCRTILAVGLQVYTNAEQAAGPVYWGHLYDGEDNVVTDIRMNGLCVRTTSNAGEANLTVFQAIGINANKDTIRVDAQAMHVKQFGYPGQVMFRGIQFDPVPQECVLAVVSAIEVRLRPDPNYSSGNKEAARPNYGGASGAQYTTGAVVATEIPAAGIAISNASLGNDTTYNVYLYAANDTFNTATLEISTTSPVLDSSGYMVKTGDPTRFWRGRVRTDGSGQFKTTGGAFLNPLAMGADQVGTNSWAWVSADDRKLHYRISATLPGSNGDSDYQYWPTFETTVAYDPPSLAAGASTTVDVTVVCGAEDYCTGVGFSTGWGGLVAYGSVKAANTVTVFVHNPTASPIDLASGSLRVAVQRR